MNAKEQNPLKREASETVILAWRLGQDVRELRRQKGWSLGQLAEKSGIDKSVLSRIERGETLRPHLPTLQALGDAFDIDIKILDGQDIHKTSATSWTAVSFEEAIQILETIYQSAENPRIKHQAENMMQMLKNSVKNKTSKNKTSLQLLVTPSMSECLKNRISVVSENELRLLMAA